MLILTIIDSLAVGGSEQSLSTLTPHLTARGVDMHVAFLKDRQGVGEALEAGGATLHSLDVGKSRLGGLIATMRLIRSLHPDVVHTTLFEADIIGRTAAWLLRTPVISSFVTESYGPEHVRNPEYRAFKVRAAQLVDAITARFVTRFHAVSASSATVMSRRLRVPREKIDVVPRGRDQDRLGIRTDARRLEVRTALGLDDTTPLVLAVARHFHLKGLDIAVRAFSEVLTTIPQARLLIAGREGPATPAIRRLISDHGIEGSVTIAGFRSDVGDLMCAADVFVLPSRAEGSPGALIEALALEVPIVASDIPSVREVVDGVPAPAVLTTVESAEETAAAISGLLEDSDRAVAMTTAGRDRFLERYTVGVSADATIELYRRCLAT